MSRAAAARSFGSLAPVGTRAVVINAGTEVVTTLALASAAQCGIPVLLVNCTPTGPSHAYFDAVREKVAFDVVERPLRSHGETLDALFRESEDDLLLLLDSDAEIREPRLIDELIARMDKPLAYGAGFLHGQQWFDERHGVAAHVGINAERPWIPTTLLRVRAVRAALDAGVSFRHRVAYNDLGFDRRASRWLGRRFQSTYTASPGLVALLPNRSRTRLRRTTLPHLRFARSDYFGLRPNFVFFDTGADIHHHCKYAQMRTFAGLHVSYLNGAVLHYQGTTQKRLHADPEAHALATEPAIDARRRLAQHYGVDVARFARTAGLNAA